MAQQKRREHISFETLMIPGTDPDIIAQYQTLAERSEQVQFGLIEEDIIILDTETTGLDPQSCELIQVAAARVRGNTVVATFNEFCKPIGEIPTDIQELTHITPEDVEDARSAAEVVSDLCAFVAGAPVVAHNAGFDRTFLESAAPNGHITDFWVDSLVLARIALPRLSSHRLAYLAELFGADSVSHRADDDVAALIKVWRILLTALCDLPAGLLERLGTMHPEIPWSLRPIFTFLAHEQAGAVFSLGAARDQRIKRRSSISRSDIRDLGSVFYPEPEEIAHEFSLGGLVTRMYEGFEARPGQLALAEAVRKAFAQSTYCVAEAGTGVGKSVAYLVPACAMARQNHVTVGVATKTNALMDQLLYHELPKLERALGQDGKHLTYQALKGYEHYPCLRKLERLSRSSAAEKEGLIHEDSLNMIAILYAFASQSSHGDLDNINLTWKQVPRDEVTTTSAECVKRICPFYPNRCFVHGARRRAEQADIVLTNHALLLRDVMVDGAILPPIRHWVIDEAHSFEQEARRQWARSLSHTHLKHTLETLGAQQTGMLGALSKNLDDTPGATLVHAAVNKAAQAASALFVQLDEFFLTVKQLSALDKSRGGYDVVQVWLGEEVRASDMWSEILESGQSFLINLQNVAHLTQEVVELGQREAEAQDTPPKRTQAVAQSLSELQGSAERLRVWCETLELVLDGANKEYVMSALVNKKQNLLSEELIAERFDVGSVCAELWYPEIESVVYTSATLAIKDDFSHFKDAVGLSNIETDRVQTLQIPSGYDYQNNMSIVVVKDIAPPSTPQYLDDMERFLLEVHRGMGGSTLTLFTNRKEMERLFDRIEPVLTAEGQRLVCQKRGIATRQVRQQFLESQETSLFALRSFWEGFDAAGDTLKCVVIPKLPFPNPNNPLSQERSVRDQRSWFKYDLPESVITVKQAAGRLIRTSTDTGCFIIADTRVLTKAYGQSFLKSLPKSEHMILSVDEVRRYLELFSQVGS